MLCDLASISLLSLAVLEGVRRDKRWFLPSASLQYSALQCSLWHSSHFSVEHPGASRPWLLSGSPPLISAPWSHQKPCSDTSLICAKNITSHSPRSSLKSFTNKPGLGRPQQLGLTCLSNRVSCPLHTLFLLCCLNGSRGLRVGGDYQPEVTAFMGIVAAKPFPLPSLLLAGCELLSVGFTTIRS